MTTNKHTEQSERAEFIDHLNRIQQQVDAHAYNWDATLEETQRALLVIKDHAKSAALLAADKVGGEPVAYTDPQTIRLLQEPTASGLVTTQLTRHRHDPIRGTQVSLYTHPQPQAVPDDVVKDAELPPLPEPLTIVTESDIGSRAYTPYQMRDYARAAIDAAMLKEGK